MWQDIVLTAMNGLLAVPLLPTVFNENASIPRTTSIPTGAGLLIIGVTYWTLGFWYASSAAIIQSSLWVYVAVYRSVDPEPAE